MKGLTLIEFIIYIGILVMVIVFIGGFLWNIIFGNIKEISYQEVQQNGRFALLKITREIKKAIRINSPLTGEGPSSTLSLAMSDPNLNPTVFDVSDNKLRIIQGSNQFYLTSEQVIISGFQFTNLSYEDTPGIVRAEMTIDHVNYGNRTEYQATINLKSSISLIPGGAAPTKEILRPAAFTDSAQDTINPEMGFDKANGTTWAQTPYSATADPSIVFHTWQTTINTYNDLTLKYRYHATAGIDDTYSIAYSTDGGTNWTDLIPLNSEGVADTTVSIDLLPDQDLSQLQVKVYTQKVKGTDKQNIFTRDIWTEGIF